MVFNIILYPHQLSLDSLFDSLYYANTDQHYSFYSSYRDYNIPYALEMFGKILYLYLC